MKRTRKSFDLEQVGKLLAILTALVDLVHALSR